MPFLGGKTGFFFLLKTKKGKNQKENKKQKKKTNKNK